MALTKPILNQVPAWDATEGYTFTFDVIGGDQVVGSILTIKNNVDDSVVYEHTQSPYYSFINEIPADVGLVNGGYYSATIKTINANDSTSTSSNPIQFYCYETPTITVDGFTPSLIVESSEYVFTAQYRQADGEYLNSYRWILYDASSREIANSGIKYASNITPEYSGDTIIFNLSQQFGNFENGGFYSLEVICDTVNDTRVTTEKLNFSVDYRTSSAYAEITATNNCDKGYIVINSNAVALDGRAYPTAIYIDNDAIDLRSKGSYVVFDQGYEVPNDFTTKMWFSNVTDKQVLVFQNGRIIVEILESSNVGYLYCKVTVDGHYVIFSDDVLASKTNKMCVQLRKINHIYEVMLERVV